MPATHDVDRHRRDGVDVERAVPAEAGPLRLPARERRADRLDDLRRAHRRVRPAAHGPAQLAGLRASSGSAARSRTRGRSARSSARARRRTEGRFDDEIVAVGELTADEAIRRDTSLESLAKLKPVFDPEGTTTAGNAPGVNDGASCVVVTSEEFAQRRGLEILGTIVAQGYVADEFAYLVRTPANAAAKAFEKAGKTIDDVKRVEINEAFASVALNSTRLLGADEEIVNVNGGAVALGHPIGASGGRIVGTMVHELRRNGGGLGLAAICSGGGQGDALLIEV